MTAAVLALTMAACGGGSSSGGGGEKPAAGGGETESADTNCVYSAEQIILDDEGALGDLSVDGLYYKDGKLYATGFYYGDSDTGSHVLLNFDPDGSNLQFSPLMGGMDDIICTSIGSDGNYYVARISYDADEAGFSANGSTQPDEHAGSELPGDGAEGSDVGNDDAGPGAGDEEAAYGPTAEAAMEEEPGGPDEEIEEFISEGEVSPADEESEEANDGITSPQDEYPDDASMYDAEEELIAEEVVEEEGDLPFEGGEAVFMLTCISADGTELWNAPVQTGDNAELDFYINAVAYSDEGVLVGGSNGLDLYSKDDGTFIRNISAAPELVGCTPYVLGDGTVAALTFGQSGDEISTIDLSSGSITGHYPVPSEAGMVSVFPGKSYAFYLTGNNAVFGMNLDDTGAVKVLDYVDSDMDITAMPCLTEMDDGKLAAVVADDAGTNMVQILTKVDAETVANRKTLTLGCYYLDYEVRKQIFAFNKQSSDVRITITDYSQYDSDTGTEGMAKLNTDIASGMAPDILILSAAMPIKSYTAKGVFEDLTPYIEGDEEISQKEYLENIQEAFKVDGKTFAIVPSFYVSMIAGKTEDIGDGSGLTLDFADELAKKKGVEPGRMFGISTRDEILYLALELCGGQFIDWDQSKCSFDSPEFIRLLEFINQFPEKIDESRQEDTSADYRNGKALFHKDAIGTFDEYVNIKYGIFGTDITMTGFPSQTPGKAAIFPQLEIAINAASQEKDACWSFVRRFLLDDYQNSIEMYWPISIASLDQLANKAMEPLYYEDENGNQVEDHIIVNIGGEDIALPRISDTEIDQMYSFLKDLDSEAYYDVNVENIIAEEAAAYFAGQKSAEDAAGVIQSRVQIYINENS